MIVWGSLEDIAAVVDDVSIRACGVARATCVCSRNVGETVLWRSVVVYGFPSRKAFNCSLADDRCTWRVVSKRSVVK